MQINTSKKRSGAGKIIVFVLAAFILAAGIFAALVFFENSPPAVQLTVGEYIGKNPKLALSAGDDNSGLRSVKLVIRQDDREHVLIDEKYTREGYSGTMGPTSFTRDIAFTVEQAGMKNGAAKIIAEASDYSLRGFFSGNRTEVIKEVTIDTLPPKLRVAHAERYIDSGGSGIIIYSLDGETARHGAEVAGYFHAGHPLGDGRENMYISYLAVPYDAEDLAGAAVVAEDAAGNKASIPFTPVFKKTVYKHDRINIGDDFLAAKIPEFEEHYPEMQGDMKEKYLYTNRQVRDANNAKIFELCQNPEPQRLWQGRFQRMFGASRAGYADHRTYYYQSEEIDKQVHLGMDIASTQQAEVRASNKGKVVFADYLGIYGKMVLLDHGQGVFSLYSHLSSIQVAAGDIVDTDAVLGLTGTSGMAGGDHLHFSMLVNGVFVTPKEWWDPQWIAVTIEEPLVSSKF